MAKNPAGSKAKAKGKNAAASETAAPKGGVANSVTHLTSAATIKSLLKSAAALKENLDELSTAHATEMREAVDKKHLDKQAFDMIKKLNRLTPEKLAARMEAFDHYFEVSGLEARANSAPRFEGTTIAENGGGQADDFQEDPPRSEATGGFPATQTH